MAVVFAFTSDPLRPARVDVAFEEQAEALREAGVVVTTYDGSRARIRPVDGIAGATLVYRGWMMNADEYATFERAIRDAGATPLTDVDAYLSAHHAPRWIPVLGELTPETAFFDADADVESELTRLGWDGFVLKDWVKSLKTSRGSILRDPALAPELVEEMRKFRGTIEGGLVVRRLEPLLPQTERRYFALDGRVWSATDDAPPPLAAEVAARVRTTRFFSVDVAERADGQQRVVEIGDGQVSDLVGWSPIRFAEMWRTAG